MCIHDSSFTDLDCLYAPWHWRVDEEEPEKVLARYRHHLDTAAERIEKSTKKETHRVGEDEREAFDVFGSLSSSSLLIWIHGGYWQTGTRADAAPLVEAFLSEKQAVVAIGYRLADPDRPLSNLIEDIKEMIEKKVLPLFPDAKRIVIGGHSAGGHLTYKVCAALKSARVNGMILLAGIYQLQELQKTAVVGEPIGMIVADAEDSSCRYDEFHDGDAIETLVLVGKRDTPRFVSQATALHAALLEKKMKSQLEALEGHDHFTLIDFSNPESRHTKEVKRFLQVRE